jgi:hypothetical protein
VNTKALLERCNVKISSYEISYLKKLSRCIKWKRKGEFAEKIYPIKPEIFKRL